MYLPTVFYTLATITITAAAPVAAGNSVTAPTPTQAIAALSQVSPVASPLMLHSDVFGVLFGFCSNI